MIGGVSLCVSWAVSKGFKMGFEQVGSILDLMAESGRSLHRIGMLVKYLGVEFLEWGWRFLSAERALRGAIAAGYYEIAQENQQAVNEAVLRLRAVELAMRDREFWEMMLWREGVGGVWMLWTWRALERYLAVIEFVSERSEGRLVFWIGLMVPLVVKRCRRLPWSYFAAWLFSRKMASGGQGGGGGGGGAYMRRCNMVCVKFLSGLMNKCGII